MVTAEHIRSARSPWKDQLELYLWPFVLDVTMQTFTHLPEPNFNWCQVQSYDGKDWILNRFVFLFQLRAAAALQSRINQAQAHSRAAALIHAAASAQPALSASTFESRAKIVTSPLPVIPGGRPDLSGHIYYQQPSPSHRRTPQTHLPPPSAPSSAPSSIIQLSAGKKKVTLVASQLLSRELPNAQLRALKSSVEL